MACLELKENSVPAISLCSVVSLLSFPSRLCFTLLLGCTSIDAVVMAPVESSLSLTAKDKTLKRHQGCLEHPLLSFLY